MTTTDTDVMLREWVTVHRKPQPHGMTRAAAGHRHQVRDLTGQRFGRLVALRYAGPSRYAKGGAEWECRCDCGNLARVPSTSLTNGRTRSCGCLRRDHIRHVNRQRKETETTMGTVTRCQVCGGLCLTSWQIMCRTCADCLDRQQHWKDRP